MATVRFALVGVCYISEEHARLSGPPLHRDMLGKELFFVSCACVRWACCGQNHLAEPVKKVVCILLLSGLQRCFDDGGLFLVMDDGCSSCAQTASIVEELTTTYWLVQQLDKQTPLQKGHKRSISSTSNLGISDHHAIFFDSKMCATRFKPVNRILYMWGNVNINAIKQKRIALSNTYYSTNIHLLIIDTAVYEKFVCYKHTTKYTDWCPIPNDGGLQCIYLFILLFKSISFSF